MAIFFNENKLSVIRKQLIIGLCFITSTFISGPSSESQSSNIGGTFPLLLKQLTLPSEQRASISTVPEISEEVIGEGHEITSIPVDRFYEMSLAESFKCGVCLGVPLKPIATNCDHIYCEICLISWLDNCSSCPFCRALVENTDYAPLKGFREEVFETLRLTCVNRENGCQELPLMKNIGEHEEHCQLSDLGIARTTAKTTRRRRGPQSLSSKRSLKELKRFV